MQREVFEPVKASVSPHNSAEDHQGQLPEQQKVRSNSASGFCGGLLLLLKRSRVVVCAGRAGAANVGWRRPGPAKARPGKGFSHADWAVPAAGPTNRSKFFWVQLSSGAYAVFAKMPLCRRHRKKGHSHRPAISSAGTVASRIQPSRCRRTRRGCWNNSTSMAAVAEGKTISAGILIGAGGQGFRRRRHDPTFGELRKQ